ncbi:MAG: hypothetical protein AB1705_02055 [Verrucomicrobiota bacterium]
MKTKLEGRKLNVRFGSRTRFRIKPETAPRFRITQDLEQLKEKLVNEHLAGMDSAYHTALRRAAEEAASLAWIHPQPLLVFPVLLEEKGREALRWAERQRQILDRSQTILSLSA